MTLLSRSEEQYISLGCQDDGRIDGRRCLESRDYVIVTEKGYLTSSANATALSSDEEHTSSHGEPPFILSNGSARLTTLDMQETILCSVKAQVVRPSVSRPDRGVIEIAIDKLSAGNQNELDEIQSLLTHLLLQDDNVLVNRKALCILPHEYVWKLSIDLVFLMAASSATCRLHAVSSVVQAALESTLLPSVATQDNSNPSVSSLSNSQQQQQFSLIVQDDIQLAQPILTADGPRVVLVSVALIPCSSQQQQSFVLIVDGTSQEQACAVGQVHVAVQVTRPKATTSEISDDQMQICAVQASGKIPVSSLPEIMGTAVQFVKGACQKQQSYRQTTGSFSLLQEPFGLQ
ncbi:hypothetical protein MPSEU_000839000 [Mayamaea pseudoterrestris]|nr:hypothetical protein MPSEU_000839000 [Mayamaea pseudoterrestris]